MNIEERLEEFVDWLDNEIERQLIRDKLSAEDGLMACAYAHAYEKDKNAILAILNGKRYCEDCMNK
jgi:hypothetical protein